MKRRFIVHFPVGDASPTMIEKHMLDVKRAFTNFFEPDEAVVYVAERTTYPLYIEEIDPFPSNSSRKMLSE